jgi:hypothetical protein
MPEGAHEGGSGMGAAPEDAIVRGMRIRESIIRRDRGFDDLIHFPRAVPVDLSVVGELGERMLLTGLEGGVLGLDPVGVDGQSLEADVGQPGCHAAVEAVEWMGEQLAEISG